MNLTGKDRRLLQQIYDYCERIERSISGPGAKVDLFLNNQAYTDSVSADILQIGRLTKRFSDEFLQENRGKTDWRAIQNVQSLYARGGGTVDPNRIWETATEDIPELKAFCAKWRKNMNKRSVYRILLLLCPAVLGAIGFLTVDRMSLSDALFNCVQMYVVNYGESPTNIWVELARWTAPLATASSILLLLSSINRRLTARIKTFFIDTVAVYGPDEETDQLLSQLGRRGIRGGERFLPARRYILTDTQEENLAFYQAHEQELQGAQVYLRCDSLPGQSVSPSNLHLFQPMEIAARLFWKRGDLLPIAAEKGAQLHIACVGFGKLGEELLYWGLQNNIFSPEQRICYHIFGDASDFLASHPMLSQIADPVITYEDGWQKHLDVLSGADLIMVLPEKDGPAQETTVYQLLSLVPGKEITVFADAPAILSMLDEQQRLRIVDVSGRALRVSHILEDDLLRDAMKINLRYAHLYNGVVETAENARAEWDKLSAFLRYSNISSADYHAIRLQMLHQMGAKSDGSDLTGDQKELLSELEHMRWCRYHWLNNWRYGKPEDGKAKDAARRIHVDLVPYGELSEEEKQKDRSTIDVMLGL